MLQFDPAFAIRGLTIDKEKGLLCKISSHQKLSYTGVFRGRERLSRREIMELYHGSRHISVHDRNTKMEPLNDLFSVAHACLFADVVQFMLERDIEYEPIAVVEDVGHAVTDVHVSGAMHKEVAMSLSTFIEPNPSLRPLLERIRVSSQKIGSEAYDHALLTSVVVAYLLQGSGKKVFLCTNSSFQYIDAGLQFMLGQEWRKAGFIIKPILLNG